MIVRKTDFVNAMAECCDITKVDAAEMYDYVFDVLFNLLSEGNDVVVHQFGKFVIKERAEKRGRNPQTGEEIVIPSKKAVSFKPAKSLKEAVSIL